jgi:predicted AAA+ superfamily ATPase
MMIDRLAEHTLHQRLRRQPAVVLIGPRQVGKTTLARQVAAGQSGAVFLDLERESDHAALGQPALLLPTLRERLVVLDEVQLMPQLFAALRPEIDDDRRPGRFLLLGSASGALMRQSAESLAGRIATVELTPFLAAELRPDLVALQALWLRGGYPLSWLAADDAASYDWRSDFLRTFLQRDLPAWGVRVPAETLRRFWTMLAHLQGQVFNASQLGAALGGVAHTTVGRYLDTLVDALVVRRLQPVLPNVGKRLVKSPKVYLRDSGLLHALLGITDLATLQGHPVAGASWEGFVVEQVAAALPADATLGYYRTAAGAEIDLVVEHRGRRIGFEVKFSAAPRPTRGFWHALADLQLAQAYVVAPVPRRYPLASQVEVLGVGDLGEVLGRALAGA